jgi:hypothetical protein
VQTLSNLGDALVQQGEAAIAVGNAELGQHCFQSALSSYEASCSQTDSGQGDDLPGLLHNWGVGLHTISSYAQVKERGALAEMGVQRSCWGFSVFPPSIAGIRWGVGGENLPLCSCFQHVAQHSVTLPATGYSPDHFL